MNFGMSITILKRKVKRVSPSIWEVKVESIPVRSEAPRALVDLILRLISFRLQVDVKRARQRVIDCLERLLLAFIVDISTLLKGEPRLFTMIVWILQSTDMSNRQRSHTHD